MVSPFFYIDYSNPVETNINRHNNRKNKNICLQTNINSV